MQGQDQGKDIYIWHSIDETPHWRQECRFSRHRGSQKYDGVRPEKCKVDMNGDVRVFGQWKRKLKTSTRDLHTRKASESVLDGILRVQQRFSLEISW